MRATTSAALAIAFVAGLNACSSTPRWDARFGDPVRVITAQQVIAPEASRNRSPVTGIDGQAAQGAMGEYTKSYTQPSKQPDIVTIGVGSGGQ